MSQQTNSGFNPPGFSIGAKDPGKLAAPVTPLSVGVIDPLRLFSYPLPWVCDDFGVGQVASSACLGSGRPFEPYISSLDFCDLSDR